MKRYLSPHDQHQTRRGDYRASREQLPCPGKYARLIQTGLAGNHDLRIGYPFHPGRQVTGHSRRLRPTHDRNRLFDCGALVEGELQQLDAGSWKGLPWKGEKLPSLEEAIAAMPADKRLLIEIKGGPEVIPELTRVIRASGKEKQIVGFRVSPVFIRPASGPERNYCPTFPFIF